MDADDDFNPMDVNGCPTLAEGLPSLASATSTSGALPFVVSSQLIAANRSGSTALMLLKYTQALWWVYYFLRDAPKSKCTFYFLTSFENRAGCEVIHCAQTLLFLRVSQLRKPRSHSGCVNAPNSVRDHLCHYQSQNRTSFSASINLACGMTGPRSRWLGQQTLVSSAIHAKLFVN